MSIVDSIALVLNHYKAEHCMSIADMAKFLDIAESSLQCYIKGTANPRASTIELLAAKLNLSVAELVSVPNTQWRGSEALLRATREFGVLTQEDQAEAIRLFRRLADLLYGPPECLPDRKGNSGPGTVQK